MNMTLQNYVDGNSHPESAGGNNKDQPKLVLPGNVRANAEARKLEHPNIKIEGPIVTESTKTDSKFRTQDRKADRTVIPEKTFKNQVKILHSFDEDDGEVNVENLF